MDNTYFLDGILLYCLCFRKTLRLLYFYMREYITKTLLSYLILFSGVLKDKMMVWAGRDSASDKVLALNASQGSVPVIPCGPTSTARSDS